MGMMGSPNTPTAPSTAVELVLLGAEDGIRTRDPHLGKVNRGCFLMFASVIPYALTWSFMSANVGSYHAVLHGPRTCRGLGGCQVH